MKALLREFVDTEITDLDIHMVHRTPTGKPNLELRPRRIHVFFGKFTEKESEEVSARRAQVHFENFEILYSKKANIIYLLSYLPTCLLVLCVNVYVCELVLSLGLGE